MTRGGNDVFGFLARCLGVVGLVFCFSSWKVLGGYLAFWIIFIFDLFRLTGLAQNVNSPMGGHAKSNMQHSRHSVVWERW